MKTHKASPWLSDMMTEATPRTVPSASHERVQLSSSSTVRFLEEPNTFSITVLIEVSSLSKRRGFRAREVVYTGIIALGKAKVTEAIESMYPFMGTTDVAALVWLTGKMMVEEGLPADHVIFLVTDEQKLSEDPQDSERKARNAGEECCSRAYTLDVGGKINVDEIYRVAVGTSGAMYVPETIGEYEVRVWTRLDRFRQGLSVCGLRKRQRSSLYKNHRHFDPHRYIPYHKKWHGQHAPYDIYVLKTLPGKKANFFKMGSLFGFSPSMIPEHMSFSTLQTWEWSTCDCS